MYKRIILKLSGEALSGETTQAFDLNTIKGFVSQIKQVINNNTEVAIVIGGGNFWRGRDANTDMDRTKADQIGMLATVMNAVYFADSLKQQDINAVIMTPFVVGNMTEQFSKDKALEYMSQKKVLIFAGGIGHPFFSTDTVTALRASELEADAILFAKSIDGVYDKDPAKYSDAKKYDELPCKKIIENHLQVIDITAASLCYEQKIPVIIFGLLEEESIIKVCSGEKIGTIVSV